MKVLQILPALDAGGVERGTLEIASHLVGHGHQALVVSNGGRMVAELEKTGARHIAMPVHRKNPLSLLQVRPLRRLLEMERPDILHIRSRVPGWIAWLAWRGMDPATRPRLVSTVHGFYSVNRYSAIMTAGERVIAVSNSIRRYILENYPATRPEAIRVIPRGIEPAEWGADFQPSADWLARWHSEHPQLAGKKLLLLPGRITRLKGHEDFFRLIAALKQQGIPAHGLVAGDTHPKKRAYLGELQGLVAELGLTADITFLGHRGDLREIMAVSDLICALSQQPESFGRTVLEALAIGKPVAGYDCGGVGELLEALFQPGKVPPGDAAHLLEASRSILRSPPKAAAVGEPYTLECMCRTTLTLYQELLASPR
jgi:glycosyltransferase involved in cell wall biosynthesis